MSNLSRVQSKIKQSFKFLYEQGFSIIDGKYFPDAFGDWIVVLASSELKVRICQERNYVYLLIGPSTASPNSESWDHYYSLEVVMVHVTGNVKWFKQYFSPPHGKLEKQLDALAKIFAEYYDRINDLFSDNFEVTEPELKRLGEGLRTGAIK